MLDFSDLGYMSERKLGEPVLINSWLVWDYGVVIQAQLR